MAPGGDPSRARCQGELPYDPGVTGCISFLISVSAQACVETDFHSIGTTETGGIGIGTPSVGVSATSQAGNAGDLHQLSGPFDTTGASVGPGTCYISTGQDCSGRGIIVVGGGVGIGVPPVEGHDESTNTYVQQLGAHEAPGCAPPPPPSATANCSPGSAPDPLTDALNAAMWLAANQPRPPYWEIL